MVRRSTLMAMAVAAVALLLPLDTSAEPTDEELAQFERHLERGSEMLDRHDYETAIEEFRHARELIDHPRLTVAIADAYRDWGRCARAETIYRDFLQRDDVGDDRRSDVRNSLDAIDECDEMATLRIICDPADTELRIDGDVEDCPYEEDVSVGTVEIRGNAPGFESRRRIADVERETTTDVALELTAEDDGRDWSLLGGYGAIGVGSLLVVGGGIGDYRASSRIDEVEEALEAGDGQRVEELAAAAESARTRIRALYVSGTLLTAAGVGWVLVRSSGDGDGGDDSLGWSVDVHPTGVMVGGRW